MQTLNEYLSKVSKIIHHNTIDPRKGSEASWNFLFYRSKNEDEYCAIVDLDILKDRDVAQDLKRIQFRSNDEFHDLYKHLIEKKCSPDFTEIFLNSQYAVISKHDYDDEIEIRYIDKKDIERYVRFDIDKYADSKPEYFDIVSFKYFLEYCHDECGFNIK